MAKWQTTDRLKLLTYNAQDAVATARVDRAIVSEEDWRSPRCQRLFQVHEELSKMGAELHSTGFRRDEARRQWLIAVLTGLQVNRREELVKHIGTARNPAFRGTDNDMRALLYRRHAKEGIHCYDIPEPEDWDDVMWTSELRDTLAVDREALLRIYVDPSTHDEVRSAIGMFWRFKAPGKALTTWVDGDEVNQRLGADGRYRADWNSAGTETMRWASELMTLPEEKDDESLTGQLPNIRWMYVASPRHVLYHWDWKQQELWMQYAINGDEELGKALRSGDVYTYDAHQWFPSQLERLFGPEWRQVNLKKQWKGGRRQTKVGHLAFQYMAGAPAGWTQALMQDRTIKFSTMKTIRELFHTTYKQTVQYAEDELGDACRLGYSEGRILFGRRYYPAPPPITEACNYPVQRTAGEMGALTMLGIRDDLVKYKVKAKILTNEHDAMTLDVHDDPASRRDVEDICRKRAVGPWTIRGNYQTVTQEFDCSGKFAYDWAESCAD